VNLSQARPAMSKSLYQSQCCCAESVEQRTKALSRQHSRPTISDTQCCFVLRLLVVWLQAQKEYIDCVGDHEGLYDWILPEKLTVPDLFRAIDLDRRRAVHEEVQATNCVQWPHRRCYHRQSRHCPSYRTRDGTRHPAASRPRPAKRHGDLRQAEQSTTLMYGKQLANLQHQE